MLLGDPAGDLCLRCHPVDDFRRKPYSLGPVAAKECVACHQAHGSPYEALLARPAKELCFFCHDDVQTDLQSLSDPHQPAAEGRCLACHSPHASDDPAQLRAIGPALCFTCHEHDNIKELIETSAHVHGAVGTGKSCMTCHIGHGGMLPQILAGPPMELCLSCHDRPIETPDGRTLTDMATMLRRNPNHHGPIRQANCSACHNPHAAPHFSLLVKEYPKEFYAPFDWRNYDLCFTGHPKEKVTLAKGTLITGFRDGDRNLHFIHVNDETKGRTCRACHEVHASQRPFYMREKVPYGASGWQLEINFEQLPDGGRCAPACHWEKTYTRSPAPEPITRPAAP
jgi:predicted CXXCH cytochrome family protein